MARKAALASLLVAVLIGIQAGRCETEGTPAPYTHLWEAEKARQVGAWKVVSHPAASGGAYVETAGDGAALEFPFEVKKETTIAVQPIWWRTGEQKPARRFPQQVPYFTVEQVWPMAWPAPGAANMLPVPVYERTGPDVIDTWQGKLFFTAPTQGRIGVMDVQSEKVIGRIEAGGYIGDLVVDRETGKVFAADSMNDKVLVFDAATLEKLGEIAVPEFPRSLSLAGKTLCVGSVLGKALTVADVSSPSSARQVALPFAPQHVQAAEDGRTVAAWPMFTAIDPVSLEERPADRLQYPLRGKSLRTGRISRAGRRFDGFGSFELVKEDGIRIRYLNLPKLGAQRVDVTVDTSPATKQPRTQKAFPPPLTDDPRPDATAFVDDLMFFTSPSTGNLGVIDTVTNQYQKTLYCGGYLSDVVVDTGRQTVKYLDIYGNLQYDYAEATRPGSEIKPKVYVADAAGNRVIVIDFATLEVEKEIPVPKMPVSLAVYDPYLFVTCREDKCLAVVDIERGKVVKRIALPATPTASQIFRLQPCYASTESYAPKSISPLRLIVGMEPMCYDAASLGEVTDQKPGFLKKPGFSASNPSVPPADPLLYTRRSEVEAGGKKFFVDNMHGIRVDATRWLDVSAVTDRLRSEEPACLRAKDLPGTITLSLDDGGECDWARNIWSTPDYRMLLTSGTEEFARWNAVRFRLAPGNHVLRVRAHSPFVRLDALGIWKALDGTVSAQVLPEPQEDHSRVPLPCYQAVFAHGEPLAFTVRLENRSGRPVPVTMKHTITDYMGEVVRQGEEEVRLPPKAGRDRPLKVKTDRVGVFRIGLSLRSEEGTLAKECHFLRLPPLKNPCLLFRAEEIGQIKKRIRDHGELFKKYEAWLRQRADEKDFLPATLVGSGQSQQVEYQRWHAVACEFARLFLGDEDGFFASRLKPITAKSGGFSSQQTDFQFGGALACIMDMAASVSEEERARMDALFKSSLLRESQLPECLLMVKEPLTPDMRVMLCRQVTTLLNYEDYFDAHAGRRGGNLWQDTRHSCACPEHSVSRMFLFYRNFFGMKRLFERPFFPGYFTHFDYVTPRYDLAGYLQGGPRYDPMKSIAEGLTRQPLEKSRNDFAGLIRRMEAAPQEEFNPLVDKDVNSVVPLMLAFGWFDPAGPEARWEDLPPSALFDGEGAAAMKSGWDEDMTDVYFVSGLRDVAYRVQPNDFQIFKAGRMLVGTAAHQGDHGNPVSCWGNVVVAGDRWTERWGQKHHARFDERKVMNRFAPETLGYALSDYRLSGFMHSSYNWFFSGGHGYGYYALTLHSHTRHPFMKDGQVLAYETWPSFDYVAGEAANAWPLEQVSEMGRQLVFIRPDVVVLYDRVKLGPKGGETAWIAAVAEKMTLGRDSFTVENDKARLLAEVLMPAQGTVDKLDLAGKYPVGGRNKYVKITPDSQGDMVEYLVVMQTGISQVEPLRPALDRNDKTTSVSFAYGEKKVAVAFNRSGEVGGRIAIKEGRNAFTHDFAERIDDSYHNWKGHRLYEKWTTDPAFRFVVKE